MTDDERIITMLRGGLGFPVIAAILGLEPEDVRGVVESDEELPASGGGITYPRIHTFQARLTTELPGSGTPEAQLRWDIGRRSTDGAQWSAEGSARVAGYGFMPAGSLMRVRALAESFDLQVAYVKATVVHLATGAGFTVLKTGGVTPLVGPNYPPDNPDMGVNVPLALDSAYTPAGATQVWDDPPAPYDGVPITVDGMYGFTVDMETNWEGLLPA